MAVLYRWEEEQLKAERDYLALLGDQKVYEVNVYDFMIALANGTLEIEPETIGVLAEIQKYKNIRYSNDDMDTMLSICDEMIGLRRLDMEPFKIQRYNNDDLIEEIKRIYKGLGKIEFDILSETLSKPGTIHIDDNMQSPMVGFNRYFHELKRSYVYATKNNTINDLMVLIHELKHNDESIKNFDLDEQSNFFLELGPIHTELYSLDEMSKNSTSLELIKIGKCTFNNTRAICSIFMANYIVMEYLLKNEQSIESITYFDVRMELAKYGFYVADVFNYINGRMPDSIKHAMAYTVANAVRDNYGISEQRKYIESNSQRQINGITDLFNEPGGINREECIKSLKRQYKRLQ